MTLFYGLFLIVAILFSSVGFGGGSLYIALLSMSHLPYQWLPIIALACNITVVSGNCIKHVRQGIFSFKNVFPFIILSVPASFFGGYLHLDEETLHVVLGGALTIVAALLILQPSYLKTVDLSKRVSFGVSVIFGGAIGFLSGVVGIGGGIFLAPLLYLFNIRTAQEIVSISSAYILLNSISGLSGQLIKLHQVKHIDALYPVLGLFMVIVFVGSVLGNHIRFKWLDAVMLKRITGMVVLSASIRLLLS